MVIYIEGRFATKCNKVLLYEVFAVAKQLCVAGGSLFTIFF